MGDLAVWYEVYECEDERAVGEDDGPATAAGEVGDVELDGIRGNGRIPDDESDIPPEVSEVSVRLPCFLELALALDGPERSNGCRDGITAGGGAFTLVDALGITFEFPSSSSPPYPYEKSV